MSDREVAYLDATGYVVNVVVVGEDDPSILLEAHGYAEWVDRADSPGVSVGWRRVDSEWRSPAPFPSWAWSDGAWVPPLPMPNEPGVSWDEDAQTWIAPPPDPRVSAIAKLRALGLSAEEAAVIAGTV